jgi:hypothetical protein
VNRTISIAWKFSAFGVFATATPITTSGAVFVVDATTGSHYSEVCRGPNLLGFSNFLFPEFPEIFRDHIPDVKCQLGSAISCIALCLCDRLNWHGVFTFSTAKYKDMMNVHPTSAMYAKGSKTGSV